LKRPFPWCCCRSGAVSVASTSSSFDGWREDDQTTDLRSGRLRPSSLPPARAGAMWLTILGIGVAPGIGVQLIERLAPREEPCSEHAFGEPEGQRFLPLVNRSGVFESANSHLIWLSKTTRSILNLNAPLVFADVRQGAEPRRQSVRLVTAGGSTLARS
jgi:hypothetical protein